MFSLYPYLHRRNNFLGHHEIRAVSDHDEDSRSGAASLSEPPHFVAHAGEAVLHVIALGSRGRARVRTLERQVSAHKDC